TRMHLCALNRAKPSQSGAYVHERTLWCLCSATAANAVERQQVSDAGHGFPAACQPDGVPDTSYSVVNHRGSVLRCEADTMLCHTLTSWPGPGATRAGNDARENGWTF